VRPVAALVLAVAACSGATGTVTVDLITAPDLNMLDSVERIRMTITAPHQVVETARSAAGFKLALDLDAENASGALIVEGFDAAGQLVACGQSPAFPVSAINASIAVYLARPLSITIAPAVLGAPRSGVAAAAISYGAVIAGGLEGPADNPAASSSIAVYNAFDHTLTEGLAMPAARADLAIAAGTGGGVYLFGGTGPDGHPTGTLWRFDTTAAPNGGYLPLDDEAAFARAGQLLVPIGLNHYLVTGVPVLEVFRGVLIERTDMPALPASGASTLPADNVPAAVFASLPLVRFRLDAFDTLAGDGRGSAAATTLPDRRIAIVGGTPSTDALIVNAATGLVITVPGVLSTVRLHPMVATTPRHVVVAGGTDVDGVPIASADVLDAVTLAPVVTLAIRARTGGFAIALPNDQVLLGGGDPASAALELFTPEPPPPGVRR
jgi:hypothetical protein